MMFIAQIVVLACLLTLALPAATASAAEAEPQNHRPDPRRSFQTIDHFTASDCWTTKIFEQWSDEGKGKVADLLFSPEKGLGLSLWRVNLGGGYQPENIKNPLRTVDTFEVSRGVYDFTRMPASRWMIAAAKARGVDKFLAFTNTPPARLTRNGMTSASPGPYTYNLKDGAEGEFASYLADIVGYFADKAPESERVLFSWVSPINEPQWAWEGFSQEGSRASNADIKRVVIAIDEEFRKRKLPSQVHVVESGAVPDMYKPNAKATEQFNELFGNYIDEFLADPAVNTRIGKVISYHSYWSDKNNQLVAHRAPIAERMAKYPGWQVWQTEYCIMEHKRDLGMEAALRVARVIHSDFTVAGATAWGWWLAVSTGDYKDGLIYTDWKNPGDAESIITPKMFWGFGNYSRFIRPGYQRIELDGLSQNYEGLVGSAFASPDGKQLVIVYANSGATPATTRLSPASGNFTRQQLHLTSDTPGDDLRPLPEAAAGTPFTIPAKSIVTVLLR
jgi:O-glycosyl hydrolase